MTFYLASFYLAFYQTFYLAAYYLTSIVWQSIWHKL